MKEEMAKPARNTVLPPRTAGAPATPTRGCLDAEKTKRPVVSWIDVILTLAHILKAGLNLVPSTRINQIVFDLALSRVEYLNQILQSKSRRAIVACDVQLKQPRCLSIATRDAESLTDIPQRRGRGRGLIEADGIKSETGFVQQVGTECVRPVDYSIPDGSITPLSGAAVAENAARECRLVEIHLRPPPEHVVILRGVIVDLQVALVVVQVVSTLIKKVVSTERVYCGQGIVFG